MIAVSSPAFSILDFEIALGFISQHFDAWEIIGEGHHFLPEIEKEFEDISPSYDIQFSAHAPLSDINIGSLNPRTREASIREVINGLKAAHRMGFDTYTFHPGFWSPLGLLAEEEVKEAVKESVGRIDRVARERDIQVAMENMPDSHFTMCENLSELLSYLEDTEIGVCFDIGHAHVSNTLEEFLESPSEFMNIHLHDNLGEQDDHLPIGDGAIDFEGLLSRLNGYGGKLVIESRTFNDAVLSKDRLDQLLGKTS